MDRCGPLSGFKISNNYQNDILSIKIHNNTILYDVKIILLTVERPIQHYCENKVLIEHRINNYGYTLAKLRDPQIIFISKYYKFSSNKNNIKYVTDVNTSF